MVALGSVTNATAPRVLCVRNTFGRGYGAM